MQHCCLWLYHSPSKAAQISPPHAQGLKNQKDKESKNAPKALIVEQAANRTSSSKESEDQTGQTNKPPHDWIDKLNASSTAVIAIFTILLFIGVAQQIVTSRAIERAWIMAEIQVDPEKPSNGKLQVFEGSGTSGDSTAVMNAVLICSNAGKTPAWIVETVAKFQMIKSLPEEPNFDAAKYIERSTIPVRMTEGGAAPHTQSLPFMPIAEGHQRIDEMAVIYGRVTYRDVFRKKRISTFGYKVRPHGRLERLEGYPEYNKNT